MNDIDRFYDLSGLWMADIGDGKQYSASLPGTLDENGIGYEDSGSGPVHPDEALGTQPAEEKEQAEGARAAGPEGELAEDSRRPNAPIATRFTRKHTYEGKVRFTRSLKFDAPPGKRVFLEAERARCLQLFIDGREVPVFGAATLCTPYVFEVTGLLNGDHDVTLVSDNSYPGLPHDAVVYSSAATDETQTNWNGVQIGRAHV